MILAKRTTSWFDLLQLLDFEWWQILFGAACLVVLVWAVMRLSPEVHEDVDPAETDQDMLKAISELRREGDLTEDEYRSIKSQLMGRMSHSFQPKPKGTQAKRADQKLAESISSFLSKNPVINSEQHESTTSDVSESNQLTSSVSLTEVPESHHDTPNNPPGLEAPQAENGEESDEYTDRNGTE